MVSSAFMRRYPRVPCASLYGFELCFVVLLIAILVLTAEEVACRFVPHLAHLLQSCLVYIYKDMVTLMICIDIG